MARIIYATHVTCDGCGTTEQLPAPSTSTPESPPGWLPYGVHVLDNFRTPILSDLCPACMKLPLAELLEHHLEHARQAP